ncbi:MAG: universal stress protein [Hyphomicrobiaceae bacterium]|nr:universal stress protein [Hyphomicrobiaceae bacterium]
MYKHILVPTDGTDLSRHAILCSLELAKAIGARVTVLRVSGKPAHLVVLGLEITDLSEETRARIRREIEDHFAWVHGEAAARGVACETRRVESEHPWKGIVETADAQGSDLIAMASYGRAGMTAKLIGSETQRVLAHSRVPVLVYR